MHRSSGLALVLALAAAAPLAAQGSTGRVQVFSESFSLAGRGPYFLRLDSGVTYRLVTEGADAGDISITPRTSFLAPIRFSSSMTSSGGAPFEAPATGEYRIESSYTGRDVVQIRIFRELRPGELAGIESDAPRRGKISPAVFVMMGLFPLFIAGVMRNGRSF